LDGEEVLNGRLEDVIGWCGILPEYNGHVFELHPLVVQHDQQGKGIRKNCLL